MIFIVAPSYQIFYSMCEELGVDGHNRLHVLPCVDDDFVRRSNGIRWAEGDFVVRVGRVRSYDEEDRIFRELRLRGMPPEAWPPPDTRWLEDELAT